MALVCFPKCISSAWCRLRYLVAYSASLLDCLAEFPKWTCPKPDFWSLPTYPLTHLFPSCSFSLVNWWQPHASGTLGKNFGAILNLLFLSHLLSSHLIHHSHQHSVYFQNMPRIWPLVSNSTQAGPCHHRFSSGCCTTFVTSLNSSSAAVPNVGSILATQASRDSSTRPDMPTPRHLPGSVPHFLGVCSNVTF